jgi:hypothetical protein
MPLNIPRVIEDASSSGIISYLYSTISFLVYGDTFGVIGWSMNF